MGNKFGSLEFLTKVTSSSSLEGEDRIALSLLRNTVGEKYPIYYIDIGCNHPQEGNNTYLFYQLGERGICIDPLPELKKEYEITRPGDLFINKGVGGSKGQSLFIVYNDNTASTCHAETADRYNEKFEVRNTLTIELETIDDLLSRDSSAQYEIPLLSIDIEGLDELVIASILNSKKVSFQLIIIEDKLISIDPSVAKEASIVNKLMRDHGYSMIAKTPLNSFYIKKDSPLFSWIPEIMRK